MKKIFDDGIMEATEYPEGWIFLRWLDNKVGHLSVKLVKDLMFMEDFILKFGYKGWFTSSEIAHHDFQMLLHKVGAQFMAKDTDFIFFSKWIQNEGDKYVWKRTVRAPTAAIS